MTKRKIIISGINMVEGGIFTILDNCLQKLQQYNDNDVYEIIALVHDQSKFNYPKIQFIEFPKSKKFWIYRFYYEYYYFKKLSKKLDVDIWFSLHDMTPNVVCKKQFVYCHNPCMFYKPSLREWFLDYKMGVFGLFYKYLYQINLKKNTTVFVQQHWIKSAFEASFSVNNVVVAKPEFTEELTTEKANLDSKKVHFFYPSGVKYYKNYEIIFKAVDLLSDDVRTKIKIHFTNVKSSSNIYAHEIMRKHAHKTTFAFLNALSRSELLKYYHSIDCLLFPSKLETWGLPISEAKAFQKPMLVANLPYAKETVGTYEKVSFFDVSKPKELANLITAFVNQTIIYDGNVQSFANEKNCENWFKVFDLITKE